MSRKDRQDYNLKRSAKLAARRRRRRKERDQPTLTGRKRQSSLQIAPFDSNDNRHKKKSNTRRDLESQAFMRAANSITNSSPQRMSSSQRMPVPTMTEPESSFEDRSILAEKKIAALDSLKCSQELKTKMMEKIMNEQFGFPN